MHIEEGLTTKEVTNLLGIADEQRVNKWCITYRKKGLSGLLSKPKGRSKKNTLSDQAQMEYELKCLRMENELLRNFLYEVERS